MRDAVRAGLKAGAFGFTTSRTNSHKTPTGEMVPGRYSEVDELLGIGSAFKGLGFGAFGVNSDFDDETEELKWMTKFGQETGRPVWFLLTDRPTDKVRWRRLMDGVHKARAEGAMVTAQVAGRPVGVMLGIDTALNPFSIRPELPGAVALPVAERIKRMQDPALRAQILVGGAFAGTAEPAVAVPPAYRYELEPHVPDGRSAELRAGRKGQHRGDGGTVEPHAG